MKCSQKGCNHTAVAQVFWPGQAPHFACHSCGAKLHRIAQACGFHLHVEDLEPVTPRMTFEQAVAAC